MIINSLIGGLGNQLFQIAAGYSLSINLKTSYAINYEIINGYGQGKHPSNYKESIFKKIPKTSRNIFKIFEQNGHSYYPIPLVDELCLIGYFQSEKYFFKNSEAIKELFFFSDEIKKKIKKKFSYLDKKKNVGIHLRRGDYLNLSDIHPPVRRKYILDSMKIFNSKEVNFIFFSDDISSIKKDLHDESFIFLDNDSELEDLFSLSICDSVIMSNSSFSWWGNWLGKKKEKTIAPKIWFGPKGPPHPFDLYDDKWIVI